MSAKAMNELTKVDRRTGGLESWSKGRESYEGVDRRTGGLETTVNSS